MKIARVVPNKVSFKTNSLFTAQVRLFYIITRLPSPTPLQTTSTTSPLQPVHLHHHLTYCNSLSNLTQKTPLQIHTNPDNPKSKNTNPQRNFSPPKSVSQINKAIFPAKLQKPKLQNQNFKFLPLSSSPTQKKYLPTTQTPNTNKTKKLQVQNF